MFSQYPRAPVQIALAKTGGINNSVQTGPFSSTQPIARHFSLVKNGFPPAFAAYGPSPRVRTLDPAHALDRDTDRGRAYLDRIPGADSCLALLRSQMTLPVDLAPREPG